MEIKFSSHEDQNTLEALAQLIQTLISESNPRIGDLHDATDEYSETEGCVLSTPVDEPPAQLELPLEAVDEPPVQFEPPLDHRIIGTLEQVVLDSAGLPWDAEIHASSKALNSNGQWKKRRNVKQAKVEEVEAAIDPATVGFGVPATAETLTWPVFLQTVMNARMAEKVDHVQCEDLAIELGVTGFSNMGSRPDLFAQFLSELSL